MHLLLRELCWWVLAGHHQPTAPLANKLSRPPPQARFLSWEYLKQEQLEALRSASCRNGPSPRQLLQEYMSLGKQQQQQDPSDADASSKAREQQRLEINLDLFSYALRRGQVYSQSCLCTCLKL